MGLDHWAGLHLFHPPMPGRLGSLGIHREMKQTSSPPTGHRPPQEDQREAQITQRWCQEALSALKPEKMHVLRGGPHSSEIRGICLCAQLSLPSSPCVITQCQPCQPHGKVARPACWPCCSGSLIPGPSASSPALCESLGPAGRRVPRSGEGGMRGFPLRRAGSGDCGSQSPSQTLGCPPLDVLALRGPWESSPVLGGARGPGRCRERIGCQERKARERPLWGCRAQGLRGSRGPLFQSNH